MQPVWSATRDTKEAAALATLGATVRIDRAVDAKSGREFATFYLGAKTEEGAGQISRLRRMYRERELVQKNPDHPLLWCLVAMRNRERLLDLANKGEFFRPARLKGGQYLLRPSDAGLPGMAGKAAVVKVTELEMAATLITLGVPLLSITGPHGERAFYVEPGCEAEADVHGLILGFRNGVLAAQEPEHPMLYCMLSLYNRAKLVRALREEVQMVVVSKPNSQKSALIRADASDPAWDRVQRHFGM